MKKMIYVTIIIVLLGVLGFYFITKPSTTKYTSPDGEYTLVVSSKRGMFDMTMPGDGGSGSSPVEVILRDKNGNVLGTSETKPECRVSLDHIVVEWDMQNMFVTYAIARGFDLKTGEFHC